VEEGEKVSERSEFFSPRPHRALQGTQRFALGGEVAERVLLTFDHKSKTHQLTQ